MNLVGTARIFTISFVLVLICNLSFSQTGTIRGTILDDEGEPLPGATVLIPAKGAGAYTDRRGIFSLSKLPAGDHTLMIVYIGYDTIFKKVTLKEGEVKTEKFQMREEEYILGGVEIKDKIVGKIDKTEVTTGVTEITPRQINILPSLGTPDLAQYMQVVPGVVSTGDQGGQLYIRGGTPVMNMVLLDGMVIYSPFHSIGLFSVFDTDYIRNVDLYSAAFPAQYGGRVSSIMDIRTRNGSTKGVHATAHANPVTAGALLEGPLGKANPDKIGGASFLLSFRESHLDKSSMALYNYVNDTLGLPYRFGDVYGKLNFTDGGNYFNLFGFSHNDRVDFRFPTNYKWNSWGAGGKFQLLPSGAGTIVSGNFAYSKFNSGLANVSENFPRRSLIQGFNGGLRFSYILNSVDELEYGITLLGFNNLYEFSNSFGFITNIETSNTEAAAYFHYKKVIRKYRPGLSALDSIKDLMVIEPGIRLHYYNDHTYVSPEPRLRMKVNLNRVSFSLGGGYFSQNLMAATSDRDVVNLFTGFLSAPESVENRIKSHSLQTSRHLVTGVEMELVEHMQTTVEGWVKDFTQLTNVNRDKIFPEDPDFMIETGIAYGLDFIFRYQREKYEIYANYGLAKVQRRERGNDPQVYPPVFDRRHNVNVVAAYKTGSLIKEGERVSGKIKYNESAWEFSLRWNLGSGFPFTQTQGFFEKLTFGQGGAQTNYWQQNGQLGVLYAEEINGGRLPYYHRLDLSAKRRWSIANKALIEANLNLVNTYNRKNVFYFDRIRFAVVHQLPILPTAGVSIKY